jgi:hypothetical protein
MQRSTRGYLWTAGVLATLFGLSAVHQAWGQIPPLNPYFLSLDQGTKTATATSGAATLSKTSGIITSEALTTAAGATYTLTITNTTIAGSEMVFASVAYGSSTTGRPAVTTVAAGSGTITVVVQNVHASAALNGTIKVAFMVLEP